MRPPLGLVARNDITRLSRRTAFGDCLSGGIAHRRCNAAVAKVVLDSSGILAVIGKRRAMPQHVVVDEKAKDCRHTSYGPPPSLRLKAPIVLSTESFRSRSRLRTIISA